MEKVEGWEDVLPERRKEVFTHANVILGQEWNQCISNCLTILKQAQQDCKVALNPPDAEEIKHIPAVARVLVEYERLCPKDEALEMFEILVKAISDRIKKGK